MKQSPLRFCSVQRSEFSLDFTRHAKPPRSIPSNRCATSEFPRGLARVNGRARPPGPPPDASLDFCDARPILLAMPTGFEKLVADAKKKITEISPTDAAAKLKSGDAVIVDVREKDEWDEGHIPGAMHLSRGTIELDVEEKVPDANAMIICHCGGGGRSALAAESLQKVGYKNVRSMAGGFKAWKAIGLPTTK
jgi:rhodanese-related sulfurtransferase